MLRITSKRRNLANLIWWPGMVRIYGVIPKNLFSPPIPLKPMLSHMGIACSVDDYVSVLAPGPFI